MATHTRSVTFSSTYRKEVHEEEVKEDDDYLGGRSFLREISLKFHPVFGDAVYMQDGSRVAKRLNDYFEDAVVFSHRPVRINECIAVKILEIDPDYCGTLRIGFTSVDPENFRDGSLPCSRALEPVEGFWFKSVLTLPINKGSIVYFKVDHNGTIYHGVDGVQSCHLWRGVETSRKLWALVEAYGIVKAIRFVDATMNFKVVDDDHYFEDENGNHSKRKSLNVPSESVKELNKTFRVETPHRFQIDCLQSKKTKVLDDIKQKVNQVASVAIQLTPPPLKSINPGRLIEFKIDSPKVSPSPPRKNCMTCQTRRQNVAFLDCNHSGICEHCVNILLSAQRQKLVEGTTLKCPICGQFVRSFRTSA